MKTSLLMILLGALSTFDFTIILVSVLILVMFWPTVGRKLNLKAIDYL